MLALDLPLSMFCQVPISCAIWRGFSIHVVENDDPEYSAHRNGRGRGLFGAGRPGGVTGICDLVPDAQGCGVDATGVRV